MRVICLFILLRGVARCSVSFAQEESDPKGIESYLEKKPARNYGNRWELRTWTDANTAIVYAHSDMMVIETPISADFLFTLKFDPQGN